MKKILSIICMMLMSTTMFAQSESKMSFLAGVGTSTIAGSDDDGMKGAFSFKIGANYELALTESFSVIPGVELVNKGFKNEDLDGTVNLYYLQVPIFAAYKFPIAEGMKLAVKAGPYLGYGILGSDIEFSYGKSSKKINIWDSDFDNNRFNAGIIAGVAIDLEEYVISLEYSRGLTKFNKDNKGYTQAFGATFAYRF